MDLAAWHWFVFGIILLILEIFVPSFTVFWFGLGAIIVGAVMAVSDIGFGSQMLIWGLSSIAFVVLWFKYFKPKMVDKTTAGIAREAAIGEAGIVTKKAVGEKRGTVRFTTPILGDDEWSFISEDEVAEGDRVFIKDFSGNTLIVVKLN